MSPNLSTPLHRSLFALPLLAVALAAVSREPPSVSDGLERLVANSIDCDEAVRPAGRLGLARMPGDLGLISRRLHCAG